MKDVILEKLEDFKFFMQDHWQSVMAFFIILGLIGGLMATKLTDDKKPDDGSTGGVTIEEKQKVVQGMFSIIDEMPVDKNNIMIQYDLFLKRPLASEEEYKQAVTYLIDVLKYKYNTKDTKLKGVSANVYDRMISYEEGLKPTTTIQYALKRVYAMELEYGKDFDKLEVAVDRKYVAWGQTELQKIEDIGDYENYVLETDFIPLKEDVAKVFTNEEFQFYIKLSRYFSLTDSWNEAIDKYLQWERGLSSDVGRSNIVQDKYMKFIERYKDTSNGEELYSSYDNNVLPMMLIKNPNWVYYVKTDIYETDETVSLRELIKRYPDYKDILIEYKMNEQDEKEAKDELIKSIDNLKDNGKTEKEKNDDLDKSLKELRKTLDKKDDESGNKENAINDKVNDSIPTEKVKDKSNE